MGVSYSVTSMKVKLRMASQRLAMLNNKKSNAIKMEQKVIASLLNDKKDESARIKTEGIYHEKNLIMAQEILQLICDLLLQRLPLITASKLTPPDDLEESIASLIFATNYLDILEMKEIAQMLAAKFGEPWAKRHLTNQSNKVNKKIVDLLVIKSPKFEKILDLMKEIADQFKIDWEPNLKDPDDDIVEEGDNESKDHYKIGAVAPINSTSSASSSSSSSSSSASSAASPPPAFTKTKAIDINSSPPPGPPPPSALLPVVTGAAIITPVTASSSSSSSSPVVHHSLFPGTLNVLIYSAVDLFHHAQSKSDVYMRVSSQTTGMSTAWKSSIASFDRYGVTPQWNGEHFPIPIKSAEDRILIEMHTVKPDVIIGYVLLPIEQIINLTGQNWCQLIKDSQNQQPAGQILISAQYLPLSSPNPSVPNPSFASAADAAANDFHPHAPSPSSSSPPYPPYNDNPPPPPPTDSAPSSSHANDGNRNESKSSSSAAAAASASSTADPSDVASAAVDESLSAANVNGSEGVNDDLDELEKRLRALRS